MSVCWNDFSEVAAAGTDVDAAAAATSNAVAMAAATAAAVEDGPILGWPSLHCRWVFPGAGEERS